jgi:hypothetical protein
MHARNSMFQQVGHHNINSTNMFVDGDLKPKIIIVGFNYHYQVAKLTSIKMNCFILLQLKTRSMLMPICLGVSRDQFPMRYLGIPIHCRRLTIAEWKLVEDRLQNRLNSWKDKLLSLGGTLILINSVPLPPFKNIRYFSFVNQMYLDIF